MREFTWANELCTPRRNEETKPPAKPTFTLAAWVGPAKALIWGRNENKEVRYLKAKKFVELVKGGMGPDKAARSLNTSVETITKTIKSRDEVGQQIAGLLDSYGWMPPNMRREVARAAQLRALDLAMDMATADPTNEKALKVVLDATRLIGDDREVRLYEKPEKPAPLPPTAITAGPVEELPAALEELIAQDEKTKENKSE